MTIAEPATPFPFFSLNRPNIRQPDGIGKKGLVCGIDTGNISARHSIAANAARVIPQAFMHIQQQAARPGGREHFTLIPICRARMPRLAAFRIQVSAS